MAIIDELLVGLGFDFDEKELKTFQKSVDSAKESMGKLIKVTFAATAAVGALLKTSATATDEVTKQARQINVLTGEYDALLHASEITTGNSQNMAGALQNLSVRASEASRGMGSGVEAFGMLGISVTDANGKLKTTDVLLSETADQLNNLGDQGQRLELADKLGIREIDLLLRDGSEGIKKLTDEAKELGVITEADSKAAEAFNDAQARMFRALDSVRRLIATGLLPQVQEGIDAFTEWVKANKEIIKQRFHIFVKVLGKVLAGLGKIFGVILDLTGRLVDALGGLDNALKLIVITFGAIIGSKIILTFFTFIKLMKTAGTAALVMNAKMMLIPLLIGAAIAALGLLIDDFITFTEGGDSLIGRLLEKFPMLKSAFETIGAVIKTTWDLITGFGEGVGEFIGAVVVGFNNFSEVFPGINSAFETMKNTLAEIWGFVEKIAGGIGEFAGAAVESVSGFVDDPLGSTGDFLSSLNPFSSEPPSSAGATNNSSKNITQTNTFSISSNNPEEVGEAVRKVVEDMAGTGIRNTVSAVDM